MAKAPPKAEKATQKMPAGKPATGGGKGAAKMPAGKGGGKGGKFGKGC